MEKTTLWFRMLKIVVQDKLVNRFLNKKNSGNQPEFHHQSKNEQFSFSQERKHNTVVTVI